MLAAPELARLLAGQGRQEPSPCLDLKVPGLQAVGIKRCAEEEDHWFGWIVEGVEKHKFCMVN